MRAQANFVKIGMLLFVLVAVYLGLVVGSPYLLAYQARQPLKGTCMALIRASRGGKISFANIEDRGWSAAFEKRVRELGLPDVTRDDWEFDIEKTSEEIICTGDLYFEQSTEWVLLGDFFDIAPLETEHEVSFTQKIKNKF